MSRRYDFESTTNVIFPKGQRMYTSVIIDEDEKGFTIERKPKRFNKEGHIDLEDIVSVDIENRKVKMIGGGYKFSMVVFAILAIVSIFVYFPVAFAFILGAVIQGWLLKTEGYNVTILINKRNQKKPIEIMCHYDESNANELKQFILAKQTAENHFQTENPIEESEQKKSICSNCGSEIDISQNFCPRCGQKTRETSF